MGTHRLLLLVFLIVWSAPVHADPGDLDLSFAGFGDDGVAVLSGYPMGGGERGMVVQPDGKIVMAGYTSLGILVMRTLPDGTLDPSFGGGDGVATHLHPSEIVRGTSVAVQADGKIVVAGWADMNPANFMVARLTASGNMDPTFSGDGWVITDFEGDTDQAFNVLIQNDGKIIAAGMALIGNDYDFAIARYNTDGSLDGTFAGDGKGSVGFGDIGPNSNECCYDIALQADGKLVMVGGPTRYVGLDGKFKIARFTVNGAPDNTFSTNGEGEFTIGPNDTRASAVAIMTDGRIVVAGSPSDGPGDVSIIRISADGILDDSFDGDGKVVIPEVIDVRDAAVQPDGRIVLFGYRSHTNSWLVFVRLGADGSLDTSLDEDGSAWVFFAETAHGYDLALLPDGRMLGFASVGNDHVLVRMWPDGIGLDGFGLDIGGTQAVGFTTPGFGPGTQSAATGLAVQVDGKIVLAGFVQNMARSTADFGVARLLPGGEYDNSFGVYGRTTFAFDQNDLAKAVAVQDDGKILVGGYTTDGTDYDFMVVRFNPDGAIDGSFGFLGFTIVDFMGGDDYANALAIAPDGKIVVAGTAHNGARLVYGVARLNSNGGIDTSFDVDGKQLFEFAVGPTHWVTSVLVQPDRKIIEGGFVGADFALVRLNENGSVDGTFGSSGKRVVDMGGNDYLYALGRSPNNGWIYGAGYCDEGYGRMALLQLEANGAIPARCVEECGHWSNGKAFVDFGVEGALAMALDLRDDNQLVAAGWAVQNGGTQTVWAQIPTRRTYYTPLKVWCAFPGGDQSAMGVQFVNGNQILTAGSYDFLGMEAMTLARFQTTGNPTAIEPADPGMPRAPRLMPPFPNPLTDRSTIAFELPRGCPVRLSAYDIGGRLVRSLAEEALPPGRHERIWDGTDDQGRSIASGVYFVELTAGAERSRQPIVVLAR